MAGVSLKPLKENRGFEPQRILLYGRPKTGKTFAAGKLARKYKVHYVGIENGHDVFLGADFPEELLDNIMLYNIKDKKDLPVGIETSMAIFRAKGPARWCTAHGKLNCQICTKAQKEFVDLDVRTLTANDVLVFDSLTQLTDSCKNLIWGEAIDYLGEDAVKEKMERDHYGQMGNIMREIFSYIQQLPCHVVCISHEQELEMSDKSKRLGPICGTQNFSKQFSRVFSHLIYSELKNGKYVLNSMGIGKNNIDVGTRSGIALEKYPEMDLCDVISGTRPPAPPPAAKPGATIVKPGVAGLIKK